MWQDFVPLLLSYLLLVHRQGLEDRVEVVPGEVVQEEEDLRRAVAQQAANVGDCGHDI